MLDRSDVQLDLSTHLVEVTVVVASFLSGGEDVGSVLDVSPASVRPGRAIDRGHDIGIIDDIVVGRGVGVVHHEVEVNIGLQPFGDLPVIVDTTDIPLIAAVLVVTLTVVVVEGEFGADVLTASGDAEGMLLVVRAILEHDLGPVRVGIVVRIGGVVGSVGVDVVLGIHRIRIGGSVVPLQLIDHVKVINRASDLGAGRRLVNRIEEIVVHRELVLLRALGRDQDDTGGSTGSVDRGGGGVLEDGDILDVLGDNVVKGSGNTINDNERAVVGHGRDTMDGDSSGRSGLTGGAEDLQTRYLALEGR